MDERDEAIERDVAAVSRISVVPAMLQVICKHTGLGFAAVARVTDASWTACAVHDNINFGIRPGGKLDISTTLCLESRAARRPVVIDHATNDPIYRDHPTPRIYHIESYISVPIILSNGEYFGNLCAVDPRPAVVSDTRTVGMFTLFAELIALQLENEASAAVPKAPRVQRPISELREQFLALLGEDLLEPVESVDSSAQTLTQHASASELKSISEQIRAATQRVRRRIGDLIDFTRGRLGPGIQVNKGPVDDLAAAFESVIADQRALFPQRAIDTIIRIDRLIVCDRARVVQLLSHLLTNALVYGDPGMHVSVDAHVERGMLVIRVGNGGRPIAQSDIAAIFEPRSRASSDPKGRGLGLGLYLCAQIVNAHAGSLQVSSSAISGTYFVAMLPIGK